MLKTLGITGALSIASLPLNAKASAMLWGISSDNIQGSSWYIQQSPSANAGYDALDVSWSSMPDPGYNQWIKAFSSPYSDVLAWDAQPEGNVSDRVYFSAVDNLGTGFTAANSKLNFSTLEGTPSYNYTLYENGTPLFSGSTLEGQSPYFNLDSSRTYWADMQTVSEPGTMSLFGAGIGISGLCAYFRRRKGKTIEEALAESKLKLRQK